MTTIDYIVTGLSLLVTRFPLLTFKYAYKKDCSTHVILVEPLNEFEENDLYLEAESDFVFNFENRFVQESILFVSDNSLIKVEQPEYTIRSGQLVFTCELKQEIPNFIYESEMNAGETEMVNLSLAA